MVYRQVIPSKSDRPVDSGQQLRQDDPTALKSIIQIVHEKLPQDTKTLSSHTRFMVETLGNLKNNKIKKAAGQMAGGEAVERMKKFLSGLTKKRHGGFSQPCLNPSPHLNAEHFRQ